MNKPIISNFLLNGIIIFLLSCNSESKNGIIPQNNFHEDKNEHWSYEGKTGPEHWAEVEKNSNCNNVHQSPINIIDKDVILDTELSPLKIHYSPSTKIHDVANNGHTIQYNFENGNYITFNNEKFQLKQIHFHEESEHTINGIRYPLEMHMVHMNDKSQFVVFSVMVQEGITSEPFDFLENYLPLEAGEKKVVNSFFDLTLNLPKNLNFYYYVGSFTTPPCTEGVNWFIFKEPITISVEQVKKLQKLMPIHNYRNEQPLNGRIVKTNS